MNKTLYIIGNGFDRYHGLDTRYQAFGFYLRQNHSDIYELLIQYFGLPDLDPDKKESNWDPLWADFEAALANLDFEKVLEDNINYVASDNWDKASDFHAYRIEMEMVVRKLTNDLRKAFKEFILAVEFPESVDKLRLGFEPHAIFLTFNYTNTLEHYYGIHWKRILYIHGKALLPEEGIILGHGRYPEEFEEKEVKQPKSLNEEELLQWEEHLSDQHDPSFEMGKQELMHYFNVSFKATAEIIEKNKFFFKSLSDINKVVVLGHSISSIDQAYFKKVIESINDNTVPWIVSYYLDAEKDAHLKTLTELGLEQRQVSLIKMPMMNQKLPSLFE